MAKARKVMILRMGGPSSKEALESTLERHLDVQALPKLLAEGWVMVSASPPDASGDAQIVLERDEPGEEKKPG